MIGSEGSWNRSMLYKVTVRVFHKLYSGQCIHSTHGIGSAVQSVQIPPFAHSCYPHFRVFRGGQKNRTSFCGSYRITRLDMEEG